MIRVTIWNEYRHERSEAEVSAIYPDGIHETIAAALRADGRFAVSTATLDEPEHGLTTARLEETDVLLWWGHMAHDELADDIARRVQQRVIEGMGFVPLHSAHYSKPFKLLMGTSCSLKWRNDGERERIWNLAPRHPITDGIGETFVVPISEMYGERFDVPQPDELIFISWFTGGEVFRSGCVWNRGAGRIFYFSPGEQVFPIYHQAEVQRVIANAAAWCASDLRIPTEAQRVAPAETRSDDQAPGQSGLR